MVKSTVVVLENDGKPVGMAGRSIDFADGELKIVAMKDGPMTDGQRTWRWHSTSTSRREPMIEWLRRSYAAVATSRGAQSSAGCRRPKTCT
jgi:hypothetical protein